MATLYKQTVRYFSISARVMRRHINVEQPKVPSIERRMLNAVTVPIFPSDTRPLPVKCFEERKKREEDEKSELYEAFLDFRQRQAYKAFNENRMVAICHALPMTQRETLALRIKLKEANLQLVRIRNDIALKATENSRLQNLAPFFVSTNVYIVSKEINIADVVKVLRKHSELVLIGGIIDDRILSREALMDIAKLPPLDTLRGELLTILKGSAAKTHRLLGSHQQELSRCLGQLAGPEAPSPSAQHDVPLEE